MRERPAWCYRFRYDCGEVFYIGNTTNPFRRIKEHSKYWNITERFHIDLMKVPFAARFKIETALIRRHRPRENLFVARYDNLFKDIEEEWLPFATVYPNESYRFGRVEYDEEIKDERPDQQVQTVQHVGECADAGRGIRGDPGDGDRGRCPGTARTMELFG